MELINNEVREISALLAKLWKQALELEKTPTPEDNFFDLGGNSYKAFLIVENLPAGYKDKIEMTDFYDCETLGEIAKNLAERCVQ